MIRAELFKHLSLAQENVDLRICRIKLTMLKYIHWEISANLSRFAMNDPRDQVLALDACMYYPFGRIETCRSVGVDVYHITFHMPDN